MQQYGSMDCLRYAKVARHTKKLTSQLTTHTNTMQMPTTMASAAAPHHRLPMELRSPYYTYREPIACTSFGCSDICLLRLVLRRRPTYANAHILLTTPTVTMAAADAPFDHLPKELQPPNCTQREETSPTLLWL
jgi:hypothetical protein